MLLNTESNTQKFLNYVDCVISQQHEDTKSLKPHITSFNEINP